MTTPNARFLPSVRAGASRAFLFYDDFYKKVHRLQAVDDFLLFKQKTYRGKPRQLEDGTQLEPGKPVAVIHFNNRFLQHLHERRGGDNSQRVARLFAAALVSSMRRLARELDTNPELAQVHVFTGVTWFKAHGRSVGFQTEPVQGHWRRRRLRLHFQLLLSALFPDLAERENHRLQPHRFWLTRKGLARLINENSSYVAQRLSQRHPARRTG